MVWFALSPLSVVLFSLPIFPPSAFSIFCFIFHSFPLFLSSLSLCLSIFQFPVAPSIVNGICVSLLLSKSRQIFNSIVWIAVVNVLHCVPFRLKMWAMFDWELKCEHTRTTYAHNTRINIIIFSENLTSAKCNLFAYIWLFDNCKLVGHRIYKYLYCAWTDTVLAEQK